MELSQHCIERARLDEDSLASSFKMMISPGHRAELDYNYTSNGFEAPIRNLRLTNSLGSTRGAGVVPVLRPTIVRLSNSNNELRY